MVICSNMTNQEAYRLTGTLPADRIEDLLAKEDMLQEVTKLVKYSDTMYASEVIEKLADLVLTE